MKKFTLPVGIVLSLLVIAALVGAAWQPQPTAAVEPRTFASYEELVQYIEKNSRLAEESRHLPYFSYGGREIATQGSANKMAAPRAAVPETANDMNVMNDAADYSSTNIQVAGVDEADMVKTDGKYLYIITGDEVKILAAYPPQEARVLARIKFEGRPAELFINQDRMMVLGSDESGQKIVDLIYDIKNREKPELKKKVEFKGSAVSSRLIGDYVYLMATTHMGNKIELPWISTDGIVRTIPPTQIHYFDGLDYSYCYTRILAINMMNEKESVGGKTILAGSSQNIYVSPDNIYLTNSKVPDVRFYTNKLLDSLATLVPEAYQQRIIKIKDTDGTAREKLQQAEVVLEEYIGQVDYARATELEEKIRSYQEKWQRDLERERNQTTVHKLGVSGNKVTYRGQGEVPGRVLNQFSMDEHQGFFRIATTSESWLLTDRTPSNNIFVLDKDMKIAGKLQGLAPNERIYSARFMGQRAYLVTFRQVDPLFVIDLSDPCKPAVLGQLKIPGFSNYLHPYDENHIIGIGKEVAAPMSEPIPLPRLDAPQSTPASGSVVSDQVVEKMIMPPPVVRSEGLKISLFDVTNPLQPREVAKYVVDGYSDSIARQEHKAVLFSREKNLLVLPVSIGPPFIIMEDRAGAGTRARYGERWEGVYVFDLSNTRIKLRGKIEHPADNRYQGGTGLPVKRSLYIEEVLYTVSDQLVKMNDLKNLREIQQVKL